MNTTKYRSVIVVMDVVRPVQAVILVRRGRLGTAQDEKLLIELLMEVVLALVVDEALVVLRGDLERLLVELTDGALRYMVSVSTTCTVPAVQARYDASVSCSRLANTDSRRMIEANIMVAAVGTRGS
jgi:hypothetical protein